SIADQPGIERSVAAWPGIERSVAGRPGIETSVAGQIRDKHHPDHGPAGLAFRESDAVFRRAINYYSAGSTSKVETPQVVATGSRLPRDPARRVPRFAVFRQPSRKD